MPNPFPPPAPSPSPDASSPVPWIVPYEGEEPLPMPVILRGQGRGIQYADEITLDRDPQGVLLARGRCPVPAERRGRPLLGEFDVRRQRRAILRLLCQVCGHAARLLPCGRMLWLIDGSEAENATGRPAEIALTDPPVCPGCAGVAVANRPGPRTRFTAVAVVRPRFWGYLGTLYGPDPERPGLPAALESGVHLRHTDERLPWLLARRFVAGLTGVEAIEPNGVR
jgi:hypothetical protein